MSQKIAFLTFLENFIWIGKSDFKTCQCLPLALHLINLPSAFIKLHLDFYFLHSHKAEWCVKPELSLILDNPLISKQGEKLEEGQLQS